VDLMMYGRLSYVRTELQRIKGDQFVTIKFKNHKRMEQYVTFHNRHNPSWQLSPRKYFSYNGTKVSSKEFKICKVPESTDRSVVECAIKKLSYRHRFQLRGFDGEDIIFTALDYEAQNIIKDNWALIIDKKAYRMAPVFYDATNFQERNKYVGKFSGFGRDVETGEILEALLPLGAKHAFRRKNFDEDNNVYIEFETESDLFEACTKNSSFRNKRIKGLPRGYNWQEREEFIKLHKKTPSQHIHNKLQPTQSSSAGQSELPDNFDDRMHIDRALAMHRKGNTTKDYESNRTTPIISIATNPNSATGSNRISVTAPKGWNNTLARTERNRSRVIHYGSLC
jgi:hypothetical protein